MGMDNNRRNKLLWCSLEIIQWSHRALRSKLDPITRYAMKLILLLSLLTTPVLAASLKFEGSCSGKMLDGTVVNFDYYSNFDGCREKSKAALSYRLGRDGVITGTRSFTDELDTYDFGRTRLVFANSTGNTSGTYEYTDKKGKLLRVELSCEVRDYEYGECE